MALYSANPIEAELIMPKGHVLRSVFEEEHRPVLITLKTVNADKLRTETGKPIYEQLDQMLSMRRGLTNTELGSEILWQQFNFELDDAIDWTLLKVIYLDEREA